MNPKISITVDSRNRAVASVSGIVSVGAKVDVEVRGIGTSGVPQWEASDRFYGHSLRLRIVDPDGTDLVRFPLVEKSSSSATDGDRWTVDSSGTVPFFKTDSGQSGTPVVNFDTDVLRRAFRCVQYDGRLEFGIILDSAVDFAVYAVGRMCVSQWRTCPADDPTVLPDWRETLSDLNSRISQISSSVSDAQSAASSAQSYANSAQSNASSASSSATAALGYKDEATRQAGLSASSASSAQSSAASASENVTHYPYIHATTKHWMVWSTASEPHRFVDSGINAEGSEGETGADGESPHIDQATGRWFVGERDTGVEARGPAGTTTWGGITDRPQTFAPSPHSHALSDITGAYAMIEGKAKMPTTETLASDSSLDDVIEKTNTLICQLKGIS